jgi:hypothetical protein
MTQTGNGKAQFIAQFIEGMADEIAQLDVLEIAPDAFIGIQLGCIGRQTLKPNKR